MAYRSLEDALSIGWGIERQFRCFVHGDTTASACINSLTGLWICYACGARGKIDPEKIDVNVDSVIKFTAQVAAAVEEAYTPSLRYTESWLDVFDAGGPGDYWLGRYSAQTCRDYRLGQGPGVATYPMRDNVGRVMGIVTRDLTGKRAEKYKYPLGISASEYLSDCHRLNYDTVLLVEGMSDVAALSEVGAMGFVAGCYGSNYSRAQATLLRKHSPTKVLCLFDQDAAGHKGAGMIAQAHAYDFEVTRIRWDHYNDVSEMPLEVRRGFLHSVLDLHVHSS